MRNAAVVDSGPLLALFDRDDAHHARVRQTLQRNPGLRLITTWPVLTETSALLASRVSKDTELEFLDWVAAGGIKVDALDNADLEAMIGLLRKYRDLPFDFADTSVAALAAACASWRGSVPPQRAAACSRLSGRNSALNWGLHGKL